MPERLEDLARSFARELRYQKRADRTAVIYGQAITFFSAWLREQGRDPVLTEFTRAAVREWLATLADRGLEASTIRTRFKGLHRFGSWLAAEGEVSEHPMRGLAAPTAPAAPVPVLTDDDLTRLIKACAGRDLASRRDEALIRLLLDTGVRVSELTGLTLDTIDLDNGSAVVRGKGSRVRVVYYGARTVRALDRYLRGRSAHRWAHLDAVFLSQRGKLSPDGVRDALHTRCAAAGLPAVHPHQFRHTMAADWMGSGGSPQDLKRLAGWTSDVMLERYGSATADARARDAARRLRRGDRV